MDSNNFVPRVVVASFLLISLSYSTIAQTKTLGEAWKSSSSAQSPSAIQTAETSSQTETATSNKTQSPLSTPTTPKEPNIQPANPPLVLEAEVAIIRSSKLAVKSSEEEMVGIEPPTTFHATAYSLSGITRAGTRVKRGVIAADPRVLPLGSVVHLKAGTYSGLYTVRDTGSAIKGKRIDVWMPSSREARSFGRQNVRLTVMKYGGNRKPKAKP